PPQFCGRVYRLALPPVVDFGLALSTAGRFAGRQSPSIRQGVQMRLAALGVSILAIGAATVALAATAPLSKDARSKEPSWAWGFTNLDGEKLAERPPTVDPATSHTLGTVTMTRAQQTA